MNIPTGWKLVPVEPDEDMRDAGDIERLRQDDRMEDGCGPIYRAMLATAPTPPAQQDDEALKVLARFVSAMDECTASAGNAKAWKIACGNRAAVFADARTLLAKRGKT